MLILCVILELVIFVSRGHALQCGGVSSLKQITIKNPSQQSSSSCQYTIQPYSRNVCQLLIDFQKFVILQPEMNAAGAFGCTDYLRVGNYTICGDNSQQHLYLPFNARVGSGAIRLLFSTPSKLTQNSWQLVITQLECPMERRRSGNGLFADMVSDIMPWNSRTLFTSPNGDWELLAPSGCDQFYRQSSGSIKSFNYRNGLGYYLPNMKYTICIKQPVGASRIEYTVNRFSLSSQIAGRNYDEYCHPTIYSEGREKDYLMIPQAYFRDSPFMQPTYFCGRGLLEGQVIVGSAPYIMYSFSDNLWNDDEIGFSISYRIV